MIGQFSSFSEFIAMGGHGLYVWLSYSIALLVFIYNIVSVSMKRKRFFVDAKRRLKREKRAAL